MGNTNVLSLMLYEKKFCDKINSLHISYQDKKDLSTAYRQLFYQNIDMREKMTNYNDAMQLCLPEGQAKLIEDVAEALKYNRTDKLPSDNYISFCTIFDTSHS